MPESEFKCAVRCNARHVAVSRNGTDFVTAEKCLAGHEPGIAVIELLSRCQSCGKAEEPKVTVVKREGGVESVIPSSAPPGTVVPVQSPLPAAAPPQPVAAPTPVQPPAAAAPAAPVTSSLQQFTPPMQYTPEVPQQPVQAPTPPAGIPASGAPPFGLPVSTAPLFPQAAATVAPVAPQVPQAAPQVAPVQPVQPVQQFVVTQPQSISQPCVNGQPWPPFQQPAQQYPTAGADQTAAMQQQVWQGQQFQQPQQFQPGQQYAPPVQQLPSQVQQPSQQPFQQPPQTYPVQPQVQPVAQAQCVQDAMACMGAQAPVQQPGQPLYFNKNEGVAIPGQAACVPMPASSQAITLPGGFQLVPDHESEVDIEEVLRKIPGYIGGPSEGGFSSHLLADFQSCPRKVWLGRVKGLEKLEKKEAFAFGSLFHGCLAMRYSQGSHRERECIEAVIQAGAAKIGKECRELLDGMIKKYGHDEYKTWCPRAVEQNVIFYLPPVSINGRQVRVPICLRADLILGLRQSEHEPVPGFGPFPAGVYIVDHKTTSSMTKDLVEGYGNDFQFQFYSAGYLEAGLEDVYGRLNGVMVNLAVRRKEITPDCYFRARATFSKPVLLEFYRTQLIPLATRLYQMLDDQSTRNDKYSWPKCNTQCVGRWGMCDYFSLCDQGRDEDCCNYRVNEKRIINLADLSTPTKTPPPSRLLGELAGTDYGKAQAAAAEKKQKKNAEKKGLHDHIIRAFGGIIISQIEARNPTWAPLHKEVFLTPGHTQKTVHAALALAVEKYFGSAVAGSQPFDISVPELNPPGVTLVFKKSGPTWTFSGQKGTLTWKQIAAYICTEEWFNASKIQPPTVPTNDLPVPPPAPPPQAPTAPTAG